VVEPSEHKALGSIPTQKRKKEREREREMEGEREREGERDRETETERQRQREREGTKEGKQAKKTFNKEIGIWKKWK
jgi:hypothetical protein